MKTKYSMMEFPSQEALCTMRQTDFHDIAKVLPWSNFLLRFSKTKTTTMSFLSILLSHITLGNGQVISLEKVCIMKDKSRAKTILTWSPCFSEISISWSGALKAHHLNTHGGQHGDAVQGLELINRRAGHSLDLVWNKIKVWVLSRYASTCQEQNK